MGLKGNGYILCLSLFPAIVYGADGNDSSGEIPKILTPLIVSVGAIIIAFTVAKLVDCCCQKTLERDENIESLDDQTKKILRARLIIIQMKRKEMAKTAPALNIFKKWSTKTLMSKNLQKEVNKKEKQTVITVDEADEKEKKNYSTGHGFLKQNKVANGIPSLIQKKPIVHKQEKLDSDSHASKSATPPSSTETSNSARSTSRSSGRSVSVSVNSTRTSFNSESGLSLFTGISSDHKKTSNKSVTFNENVEVKTEDDLEHLDSVKVVSESPPTDSSKPSNLKKPS